MPTFRVRLEYQREVEFFVEADDVATVEEFLDDNPDWTPGDVPGLIDFVGEEQEIGYGIDPEEKITAAFEIVAGKLMEIAQ